MDKEELRIKVTASWKAWKYDILEGKTITKRDDKIPFFECSVDSNVDFGPEVEWKGFDIQIPSLTKKTKPRQKTHLLLPSVALSSPVALDKQDHTRIYKMLGAIAPLQDAIADYELKSKEFKDLRAFFYSVGDRIEDIDPKANEYFGNILKEILEGIGYVVTIEIPPYYYPAPAQMGFIVPAFGKGLEKKIKQESFTEGYEDTYTYFSYEKPKSNVQVQLNVLDGIPEERLERLERDLKESLSPYGLKCLYLVLEGCAQNTRTNWFIFETNRALDVMGHGRDKRGIHYTRNKNRLLRSLEELTRINFTFETRISAKGSKGKEEVTKFTSPLISLTGKFEKWEVEKGEPAEKGKLIKDGHVIYFHDQIYQFIDNRYTNIPNEYLKIDAGRKPHAINLYAYIANQWRIGWHQYHGVIKQPMRQILDGAGLLKGLPKRKNHQRDFIEKIKNDLRWLKGKKEFWIKSVRFDAKNKPHLDHMATIEMADDHPFRSTMNKQIAEEKAN